MHECQVPASAVLGGGGNRDTSMHVITRQSNKLVSSADIEHLTLNAVGKTSPFRKRVTRISDSVAKMIFRQILCCHSYAIQC